MQQAKKTDAKGDPLLPCLLLGEPCPDCKAKNECTRFFPCFELTVGKTFAAILQSAVPSGNRSQNDLPLRSSMICDASTRRN